jgi:tRNA threonylcarbamoyladenosine biosynthesis protein TsaE
MSGPGRWPRQTATESADATRALAAALAPLCRAGDVVLLVGDLGTGKTVFAQGFAAALGVAGPVTSPTFALVRQYRCGADSPVHTLIHADVYRTG